MGNGISSLWKHEDWWAIWFGAIIIVPSLTRLVTKVPKVGKWTDNPLTAFGIGSADGTIFLPLAVAHSLLCEPRIRATARD